MHHFFPKKKENFYKTNNSRDIVVTLINGMFKVYYDSVLWDQIRT